MNKVSDKIFEFWTANPDATIDDFSDYLKVIWPARGPPSMRSLCSTVQKSILLEASGTRKKISLLGKPYLVKTWRIKNVEV
jgi:hypothetical protein